jgi:hypothetical protein
VFLATGQGVALSSTGGLQYSFTQKFGFNGIGGTPERNENTFFTSLRYYPF